MASLQNQQIDQTYAGLIKTNDEAALGATEKVIQDGAGNDSTLSMGTASASFTGTLDLSGATVTGLPAGAAGLEGGSGADSMQSAASLTTNAANASGADSIALGDGAAASAGSTIAIGNGVTASGGNNDGCIAIGKNTSVGGNRAISIAPNNGQADGAGAIQIGAASTIPSTAARHIAIGTGITAVSGSSDAISLGTDAQGNGQRSVSIGQNATAGGPNSIVMGYNANDNGASSSVIIGENANAQTGDDDFSIVIGRNAQSTVSDGIAIGQDAQSDGVNTIMIGSGAAGTFNTVGLGVSVSANANESIAIGYDADTQSGSNNSIAIGPYSEVLANNQDGIAIGKSTSAQAQGAIALGASVTGNIANTLSTKAIELQTNSTPTAGGIIMSDAGGTDRRLNITATGELQIDSTAVGGGSQVFGLQGGNGFSGIAAYNENTTDQYKTNVMTTGYAFQSANAGTNYAYYTFVGLQEGETISEFAVNVQTAAAASTIECAVYDTAIDADGLIYLNNRLATFGTIDSSTTGAKVVTLGTPFTMPAGKLNGQVAFVFFRSDNSSQLSGWSQGIWNGGGMYLAGGTAYRAMMPQVIPGVSPGTELPATIGDKSTTGVSYGAQTQAPLVFMYK